MKTPEEFVTFQQKMRASGWSLAKFLASEHVSSSTYYYWKHALKEFQLLYHIEQACNGNGYDTERRLAERQQKTKPIMDALKVWMETEGFKYSSSSLIGKAVNYAYRRWDNMMCYLNAGRIHIDNNLAENAIRPITLGRKNYLFCGTMKLPRI